MNDKVSAEVMFLKTAKEIWDTLKEMYSNKQNISKLLICNERLFSLRQDGLPVIDYYSELKGILDKLRLLSATDIRSDDPIVVS